MKIPSNSEKSIGLCYMLLFSCLDPTIRLTNDKSALTDKSWISGVAKYFTNSGKIVQHIRKLENLVSGDNISGVLAKEISKLFSEIRENEVSGVSTELYVILEAIHDYMKHNAKVKSCLTAATARPSEK